MSSAVTFTLSASNTLVPANSPVTVTVALTNSSGAAITVSGAFRTTTPGTPEVDNQISQLVGVVVPANGSISVPYQETFFGSTANAVYSLGLTLQCSDGLAVQSNTPQVTVVPTQAIGGNPSGNNQLALYGQANFQSNVNSGLIVPLLGM